MTSEIGGTRPQKSLTRLGARAGPFFSGLSRLKTIYGRGRNAGHPAAPPAQIPAGATNALGSSFR